MSTFSRSVRARSGHLIFKLFGPGTQSIAVDITDVLHIDLRPCGKRLHYVVSSAADTVILGFGTSLSSEVFPLDRIAIYTWSPPDGLSTRS